MNKKKAIINLILLIVLIVLIAVVVGLYSKEKSKNKKTNEEEEELKIKEYSYGSSILQIGYDEATPIVENFIEAYNNSDGASVISIMDLAGTYVLSECDRDITKFDQKYEDILSTKSTYTDEEYLIMQYSIQKEESALLNAVNTTKSNLTLIEHTEIEDLTKYLAAFTAKIHTVVEADNVDEIDTLEFLLLKKGESYHIIDYNVIEEE